MSKVTTKKVQWDSSRWGWIMSLIVTAVGGVIYQSNKIAVLEQVEKTQSKITEDLIHRIRQLELKDCGHARKS